MHALLTFSSGETLKLLDGQKVFLISVISDRENTYTTKSGTYDVYCHTHSGFVPSVTEMLSKCFFFQIEENGSIAYSSASVVSIETIE